MQQDFDEEIIDINTDKIPHQLGHYSQAKKVGNLLFLAGQVATDYIHGVAPEARTNADMGPWYESDMARQTEYILKNFKVLLEEAGSSMDHVVKAQVFMTDLSDWKDYNEVWKRYFKKPPVRTTVQVVGLLCPGALLEIDLTAVIPKPRAR